MTGAADPVPFLDVGAGNDELAGELEAAFRRVTSSGWYVLGPAVEAFEAAWAAACGVAHAVGVASGLDALALTLRALGVGPGTEVVVPSNTYIATWLAVSVAGATPVPVDPDPETHLVSADAVDAAIGHRTAAILPVHLYGMPVDVAALAALADRRGIPLVLDAAQAHGATAGCRPVGWQAAASCWSFYPAKNLGALGDGGAVTTNDAALARCLRRLRNYGAERKFDNLERGFNSRLDELQAALLQVKLRCLCDWNARRAAVAARYDEALATLPLGLPRPPDATGPAWHLYVVRTDRRAEVRAALDAAGVGHGLHYPVPPHRQPAYADLGLAAGSLPVAERLADEVLSLPIGPHLTPAQQDRVIAVLHATLS